MQLFSGEEIKLKKHIRNSIPAKMTAIGFIVVILSGNFWLISLLLKQQPSMLVVYSMQIGTLLTLLSGLLLLGLNLKKSKNIEVDPSE